MKFSSLVLDLQFGSTGKGSLVGYLAALDAPDTTVAAWGPNAGHTFVDRVGRAFIHTMLPIAAINSSVRTVLLGPGSIIHWENLIKEVQAMQVQLDRPRNFTMIVHPQAMIVKPRHIEAEKAHVIIGSTMKGTGAALIEKIERSPSMSPLVRDMPKDEIGPHVARLEAMGVTTLIDEDDYGEAVDRSIVMMIEGAQGYSLGINRKFWPYTTSREIAPSQVLSDCALPITPEMQVFGCLRTFPIRVANRFDEKQVQIGTSGGWYDDQVELSWGELGLEPEFTTVTKLKRRVFSFSYKQLHDAVRLCRPHSLFLNFVNYLGKNDDEREDLIALMCDKIEEAARCSTGRAMSPLVNYLGYGPSITDVVGR